MDKKRNIKVEFSESTHNDMSMIAEISTSPSDLQVDDFDQEFAIMTLRNMVVFPSSILPVSIGRKSTLKLAKNAAKNEEHIIIATQKIAEVEEPGFNDLHPTAVMGRVLRVLDLPGGEISAIIQTSNVKVKIEEVTAVRPYLKGHVSVVEKQEDPEESKEIKVLLDTCRETAQKFIESSDRMNPDFAFALKNFKQPTLLVNFICTNFPLPLEDKFKLLDQLSFKDCIYNLIQVLDRETQLAALKQSIQMKTREDLDRQQREYFLHQQIKNIQDELGTGENDEIEELSASSAGVTDEENTTDTILLVEDNAELLVFLKSIFANQYKVIEAADGLEGVEKARKQQPDIIVSDLMMPRLMG